MAIAALRLQDWAFTKLDRVWAGERG